MTQPLAGLVTNEPPTDATYLVTYEVELRIDASSDAGARNHASVLMNKMLNAIDNKHEAQSGLETFGATINKVNKETDNDSSIVNEPLTMEKLRWMVSRTLAEHHITLEEFLKANIDDFESYELRDLYLMTHNVLKADNE